VQAVAAGLPKGEFEFAGHVKHVETWLAPTDAEYVPISQSGHVSDPASALYFPAMHSEHVSPLRPDEPALHMQSISSLLAVGALELSGQSRHSSVEAPTTVEYLPAEQSMHAAFPDTILYLPATHCVQFPPLGPVHPALQMQAVTRVLCTGALEFDGQVSHAAAPGSDLYLPMPHVVQIPPSGPEEPTLQTQSVCASLA
jgi:hypothetical protein